MALRVTAAAVLHGAPRLWAHGGIETRVVLPSGFEHWERWETGSAAADSVWVRSRTTQSGYELAMAAALVTDLGAAPSADARAEHPRVSVSAALTTGQTFTITKLVTLYTSRDSADPLAEAETALDRARAAGEDSLYAAPLDCWSPLWAVSLVLLEGESFISRRSASVYTMCLLPRAS